MNEMMTKVNEFCKEADELMNETISMVMDEEGVGALDVLANISPEQAKLMQRMIKMYTLAKELTVCQCQMMTDMDKKLDYLVDKEKSGS